METRRRTFDTRGSSDDGREMLVRKVDGRIASDVDLHRHRKPGRLIPSVVQLGPAVDRSPPRVAGRFRGRFTVREDFNDPLPPDEFGPDPA